MDQETKTEAQPKGATVKSALEAVNAVERELGSLSQRVEEIDKLAALAVPPAPPVLKIKPLRLSKTPVTAYAGDAGLDLEFAPADGKSRVVRPQHTEYLGADAEDLVGEHGEQRRRTAEQDRE